MDSLNTPPPQHSRPAERLVHVEQDFHAVLRMGRGQSRLIPLGKPGGVLNCLHNIFPLDVRVILQQFLNGFAHANLRNYPANRYPCTPDTGLAAHHGGIQADPIKPFQIRHGLTIDYSAVKGKVYFTFNLL
jgi:hypothetical protein